MRKYFLALLIILLMISIALLVISISQKPAPEGPGIPKEIKKEQLPPTTEYVIPEYPTVTDETVGVQPPVSKEIQKEKLPVSKDLKKEKLPVSKEMKKEEAPVAEEIKKEPSPVQEEMKKEKALEKSAKEIAKLKEKCEKQTKKIFSKQYNDGTIENTKGTFLYKYKHHYNKKLNKCFMIITEDGLLERYKKLLDVEENNSYGSVRVNNEQENLGCYVLDKKCKSEEGWDLIVRPYMEE